MLGKIARPLIFYRYIAREILSRFLVTLFVFTGALFLARVLKLVDLVINKNVPISDIILLFSYVVPRFFEVAIPMALLLSVMLTFGRLSSDSELIVMRSTGMSLRRLSLPVVAFAVLAMLATLIMGLWITPWANHRLGRGIFEIAKMQAGRGLIPGVFNELGQLTIYAEKVDAATGHLRNVLIADRRDVNLPRNFAAQHGHLLSDDKRRTLTLELFDGTINEGVGLDYTMTYFQINELTLPHEELLDEDKAREGKKSDEMYIAELVSARRALASNSPSSGEDSAFQLNRYSAELHRRFVIPSSCLFVALIGMALGIQPSRGSKSWTAAANVVLGILVIIVYYLLFALASALAPQGTHSVWLVMWSPNFLVALLSIVMFTRMGSEQWMELSFHLVGFLSRLCAQLNIGCPDREETLDIDES